MKNKLFAEMIGTAFLVIGGVGTAMLAGSSVGTLGVALAFGFSLLAMIYAVGGVSGGHFNPAVTVGLVASGKFCPKGGALYIVAQVIGGLLGAWVLSQILGGHAGFDAHAGFASNGFGEHSPGGYSQQAVFICEAVMTFFFVFVILGVSKGGAGGFGPLAISMTLAVGNLVAMSVSNASLNPARSTASALMQGGWAQDQLWLFWVAPIVGAIAAGALFRCMCCESACGTGASSGGSCSTTKGSCGS